MSDKENAEYMIEFIPAGKSVKVVAIDPVSMTEVSIVGARSAGQKALAELAVRKLHYVLGKRKDSE